MPKIGSKTKDYTRFRSLSLRSPYFFKWAEQCRKIPADQWQMVSKAKALKTRREARINIADMHTMQLVNTIKWCMRTVSKCMEYSAFGLCSDTKASLLARVPQWGILLLEARERKLRMAGGNGWGVDEGKWQPFLWWVDCMKEVIERYDLPPDSLNNINDDDFADWVICTKLREKILSSASQRAAEKRAARTQ